MSTMNVSAALSNAISSVLSIGSNTEFTLDIEFTNTDDPSYSHTPQWIDGLTIVQSFAEDFADRVILELSLAPRDYMALFAASQNLQVAIRVVYFNSQTSQRVFLPVPMSRTYKAMLVNPQDLSKKYTTGSLMPTRDMPLTEQHISARIPTKLNLIESPVYTMRQQKFHGIYQKQKVADVIAHIAQSFSIKQVYLVPPDNTMVWDHIIIPPSHGIDEIFDYLQYSYGVYMKGIDWYYTNSMLYIYPAYENDPAIPHKADIYNAPSGSYAGMRSYHTTVGPMLNIVSTTDVNTADISRPSAENVGTGFSFMRAATLIDLYANTTAKGTFITNDVALTVNSVKDRAMTKKANNPTYTKTTDNIFEQNSRLAKWDTTLLECGWTNAVPYLLHPGHAIRYHFDKAGVFTTQKGILERVVYQFQRQRQLSQGPVYGGNAVLRLRAESDVRTAT